MKHTAISFLVAMSAFTVAPAAHAASDYFLKIEGVDGEAASSIDVLSWSWGATQTSMGSSSSMSSGRVVSPRDAASGLPTGKRMHKPAVCTSRDNDCDGLSSLDGVPVVSDFSVTLDQASAGALGRCATGKHFPKATLTLRGGDTVEITDVAVSSCSASPPVSSSSVQASSKRCVVGSQCPSSSSLSSSAPATVTVRLTGQMHHTKTGHVTLMK